jgi:hypothetical protein
MWPIALGIGLLLFSLLCAVIVCSRMNDPVPPRGALDPQPDLRQAEAQREAVEVCEV